MATPSQGMTDRQLIEESVKQQQELILNFNTIADNCFNDCVKDFTSRGLLQTEKTCAQNCLTKFIKSTERISEKFIDKMRASQDPSSQ